MTDVVHWVIDSIIAERAPQFTGFPTLADAAREAGHVVHECRYIPIARRIEPEPALADFARRRVAYPGHFTRNVKNAHRATRPRITAFNVGPVQ